MFNTDFKELECKIIAKEESIQDPHLELASKLFGVTKDKVTPKMRQLAKSLNYTRMYSSGRL